MTNLGFGMGIIFGLREEPRDPGEVILEMSCQQECLAAKRT